MGCGDSRDHGEEEDYLKSLEMALGFASHNVRHLDLYIRKYASEDDMNSNQYRLIGQKLNLNLSNTSGTRSAEIYFSNLLYYQGKYSRTLLLILAIMHGSGQASDRARLLFEVFDRELIGRVSVGDVSTLVSTMTQISLEQVDILINYELLEKKPAAQLREYLRKVTSVSTKAEKELKKRLFADDNSLTLAAMLRAIKDPGNARLLTTSGIRSLALEIYRSKEEPDKASK